MPHLRFRGLTADHVSALSKDLAAELAPILSASLDSFTLEVLATQFFTDGKEDAAWPFIEILMFDRPAEQKANCARHLTERVKSLTHVEYVTVVFLPVAKTDYFENGQHF